MCPNPSPNLSPSPTLSSSKVGYARGVVARWGASHAARFVRASAEATVAHVAAGEAGGPLLGVIAHISPVSPLFLPCISPVSPLYLPYISPVSPLYLPYISPISPL